jgi:hypothetical protein
MGEVEAHPNSGLPEFGTVKWPKSDISDFGCAAGEGLPHIESRLPPHPNPLPNAERESAEFVAALRANTIAP